MAVQKIAAAKTAQTPTTQRGKRKSKLRTQVPDDSSSDDSSDTSDSDSTSENSSSAADEEASVAEQDGFKPSKQKSHPGHSTAEAPVQTQSTNDNILTAKDDFSSSYLRSVAAELAEDLDKIRSANDFNESKMPMLIRALKQGEVIFSDEEKRIALQGKQS